MPSDMFPPARATDYRLRRAHEKSRNGCVRCKQQRKKVCECPNRISHNTHILVLTASNYQCDELRPSCSRCAKRTYSCQYPGLQSPESEPSLEFTPDLHVPLPSNTGGLAVPGTRASLAFSDGHFSVPGSPPAVSFSYPASPASCFPGFDDERRSLHSSNSFSPGALDATELGLLSHYLEHTSQIIPFDHVDLYALSVGMPNLAFGSKPVMSSLLALAAACKCHDMVQEAQDPLDSRTLVEIRDLLSLAERHHRASLQHIRAVIGNVECYDNILANAALMVLYTSASHALRVHLADTAKRSGQQLLLPDEVLPQHSQWIFFTRAAHTASTAVLNDVVNVAGAAVATPSPEEAVHTPPELLPGPASCATAVLSPQAGPSEKTRSVFLPLVASTHGRALESLRRKAEAIFESAASSSTACSYLELQACLETLPILEQRASAALSAWQGNQQQDQEAAADEAISFFGGQSRVSQWVGRYMVRVTSMTSPTALRRIIMSFLNQAPVGYLNLVQAVLDLPCSTEAGSPRFDEAPPLSLTHLLAMDIFAHWLVLVMLLDGVWWIGGIGQWELGQVISLIKAQIWLDQSADTGETWWPESMYLVKRELTSPHQ